MAWFRLHESTLDNPKAQRLPDRLFKGWVNLLCVASRYGGTLPSFADIAFAMRRSEDDCKKLVAALKAAELIDEVDGALKPHDWDDHQFQSDVSTGRVQKYRKKRRESGLPALGDYTKFKAALIDRDGERCVYCEATDRLVVDHMVPIALGGTDAEDNLALACKPCNSGKAGRTPEMAKMKLRVTTAASALARYRDKERIVTVTRNAPEQSRTEQTLRDPPNGGPPEEYQTSSPIAEGALPQGARPAITLSAKRMP